MIALAAFPLSAQWHILEIFPSGGTRGELRMADADGSNYVALKSASVVGSNFTLELPSALPPATRCVSVTAAGVFQYAAADCGTGGGSSFYQTMRDGGVDEAQRSNLNFVSQSFVLTDDAGGDETEFTLNTTPANDLFVVGYTRNIGTSSPLSGGGNLSADRTLSCPTCVTTNTSQTISGQKSFTSTIQSGGNGTPHIGEADDWFGDLWIADGRANRWRVGTYNGISFSDYHRWEIGASPNISQIENSSGVYTIRLNSSGSPQLITINGDLDVNNDIDATGYVEFGDTLRRNGSTIVNSSGAFVGAGVDVGSNGVGGGGFNYWNGSSFEFGQTVTFNSFPTQMVFKGGILVSYTP